MDSSVAAPTEPNYVEPLVAPAMLYLNDMVSVVPLGAIAYKARMVGVEAPGVSVEVFSHLVATLGFSFECPLGTIRSTNSYVRHRSEELQLTSRRAVAPYASPKQPEIGGRLVWSLRNYSFCFFTSDA